MNVPAASTVAWRMTSRSSATSQAQPLATSIARTRDAVPSSDPTRTTSPNGPAANASGARSRARAVRWPSSPRARRWPLSAPVPSRTASSLNQGAPRRSPSAVGSPWRAAAIRSAVGPAQALGTHGRPAAPSVVDAMNPTAPRATTPGPIHRSHRDSTMTVDLLRRKNDWREEGEAAMFAGAPYPGLTRGICWGVLARGRKRRSWFREAGARTVQAKAEGSTAASAP